MPALLDRLVKLLGLRLDSPELAAFCAQRKLKVPSPSTDSDDVRAVHDKQGGFELYVSHRIANRRFYPPRKHGRAYVCYVSRVLLTRSFIEPLPFGLTLDGARATSREALIRKLGPPVRKTEIGDEFFARELAPGVTFELGFDPEANELGDVWIAIQTGDVIDASPLHFEAMPPEGKPPHAELLATGLLLAWAADRVGLVPELARTARARQLAKRAITGRQFLVDELGGHLLTTDLAPGVREFIHDYHHEVTRRRDVKGYDADYLASFKKAVRSPFLVPDSWEAFDRLAPIIDARWADWQRTRWEKPAPKGLYEAAAKQRDAVTVTVTTPGAAPVAVATDTTQRLMAIVGHTTSEPEVKAVLVSLGLPVGKTIDQQALGKLGVSYMATRPADRSRMPRGAPKNAVVISEVTFYARGVKEYVRGLGTEVQYLAYQGALPSGLGFGQDRRSVRKKLGKPAQVGDATDSWDYPELERRLLVHYKANKTVVQVTWGMPAEWDW